MSVCASCPVLKGECPECGTFWVIVPGGKRHGLTPVARQAFDGPTSHLFTRNQLGNFIERPLTEADAAAATQRIADAIASEYDYAPCSCAYEVLPGGTYPERRYFHEPDCSPASPVVGQPGEGE